MCNYFSCIITSDFTCYWDKQLLSHDELLEKIGLKDDRLEDRQIVRIEITPKTVAKISRNREDWQLTVDEEGTLPKWFTENKQKAEEACWKAWVESVQVQLAIGEERKEVQDAYILAVENSQAELRENSQAELKSSTAIVQKNNVIYVHPDAIVEKTVAVV